MQLGTKEIQIIINQNLEKYYSYIVSYNNPRETVLNYLICEDLRKAFPKYQVETDIKLKVDDKNRYIDIIISKDNKELFYILNRREYGKMNEPHTKDFKKVEFLTSKNEEAHGIVFCFVNPPLKEVRYVVYKNGKKALPENSDSFLII